MIETATQDYHRIYFVVKEENRLRRISKELIETEVYQQLIAAIEYAAAEGQPVQEIYEAIEAGEEVHVELQSSSNGKYQLVISIQ